MNLKPKSAHCSPGSKLTRLESSEGRKIIWSSEVLHHV
ncbi:hypothetical protein T11_12406 [Trichinella zimbabwensis]|uniref:Uncharacterized protein n=1 Tax=Trichinella zimbabwensis TaxID=268475 RepID=A0A0V1GKL2_9BILA|nr:hypothetical protein T11_12406 [Trichinella zimbabwensis]